MKKPTVEQLAEQREVLNTAQGSGTIKFCLGMGVECRRGSFSIRWDGENYHVHDIVDDEDCYTGKRFNDAFTWFMIGHKAWYVEKIRKINSIMAFDAKRCWMQGIRYSPDARVPSEHPAMRHIQSGNEGLR